jgi:hypothetical protein
MDHSLENFNNPIELINFIYKMEGNTLLEKIMDYCETYDQDPQEVGEFLEEIKEFKNLLLKDCVKNNIIRDSTVKLKDDIDVWN